MPFQNPSAAEVAAILRRIKTIAVVGLSPKPDRPSHGVAKAMQGFGYRILPVRPALDEVLGEKAYPDLKSLPEPVDCVNVFRKASELDAIVDAVIAVKAPVLWIQEGIVDEAAAERAQRAGIAVVMDRCIYKDYLSARIRSA